MSHVIAYLQLARILHAGVLILLIPGWVWAQALLENPQPASFQSGIGVISGWVCSASRVDIDFDNGAFTLQAAYGTSREDTRGVCGDADNGFGLLFNWNILDDGVHTVRALADGVEFASAAFVVTTLGQGEFVQGLSRSVQVLSFPQAGTNTQLQWQESQQNFLIASGNVSGGGGNSSPTANLENPQPASFQSGINVISGWVCTATRVDIDFDNGAFTLQAAYGTSREDTRGVCGDANNGFGLLFNWNILDDGVHTVRALADGVEFANVAFTVTTLGLGEFARELSGSALVSDFPQNGTGVQVEWQESLQNFALAGARPPGVDPDLCTTQQGTATDDTGRNATMAWTNECLLLGNAILGKIQDLSGASSTSSAATIRGQSAGGFFLCGEDLSFSLGNQVFRSADFELLDTQGNAICDTLAPGQVIDVLVRVREGSSLNFNNPFTILYVDRPVVSFPPTTPPPQCQVTVSPTQLDFGSVPIGESHDEQFQVTNSGPEMLVGDVSIGLNPAFSVVSGGTLNIAAGQSQDVTVRFTPAQEGVENGSATVDSNCGSALVALVGTGGQSPQLSVSPSQLNFGQVPQNTSRTLTLTLTNVGGGMLSGDGTFFFEGTVEGSGGGPFGPLGPGESATFEFFVDAGTNVGPFSGSVDITSNGGDVSVPISGEVVEVGG